MPTLKEFNQALQMVALKANPIQLLIPGVPRVVAKALGVHSPAFGTFQVVLNQIEPVSNLTP